MALSPDEIRSRVRGRLQEQRVLVEDLLRQREQLAGSLFVRFGVCGKPSCVCRTGQKHGPYYVLSTRSGGKGGFAYLEPERLREARELVAASAIALPSTPPRAPTGNMSGTAIAMQITPSSAKRSNARLAKNTDATPTPTEAA